MNDDDELQWWELELICMEDAADEQNDPENESK
jgi:hypothetical protein